MAQETELKLAVPPALLAVLKQHPVWVQSSVVSDLQTLDNTYFDTADLLLKADKIALRTRLQGDLSLQTVKCAHTSVGGLSSRPEWEQAYTGKFDFSAIEIKPLRKKLNQLSEQLQPVFTTLFERETRRYHSAQGAEILLMLDQGEVLAQGRVQPLCELELELVKGDAENLLELAIQLCDELALRPDDVSKAQRGYQLFLQTPDAPTYLTELGLSAQLPALQAFREMAFSCIRHWQGNLRGAGGSDQPEFVHQLRISQRRLRSLFKLFQPLLPNEMFERWTWQLADNARAFAQVRDLDVLCDELIAPLVQDASAQRWGMQELYQLLQKQRKDARQQLLASPVMAAQGALVLRLVLDLHRLDVTSHPIPLKRFVRPYLQRLQARAEKRYLAAQKGGAEALHRLRIALKPLRYALEFFLPLLPKHTHEQVYQPICTALKALGYLNDLASAQAHLAGLRPTDLHLQTALAYLSGRQDEAFAFQREQALRLTAQALKKRK